MGYPWGTNDTLTAADLNAAIGTGIVSTGLGALTAWTPVITQSATCTHTEEYAAWFKVGRKATVFLSAGITSAGTAANVVLCTFPSAIGTVINFRCVGVAGIFDTSAGTWYNGMAIWNSATTFKIQAHNTASAAALGNGGGFTAALASGDLLVAQLEVYTTT